MKGMSIQEAFRFLKNKLASIYDTEEAANIADWIIEDITGKSKLERLITGQELLSEPLRQRLAVIETELLLHKPVQYILGKSYFAGMTLKVNEQVLIPRPETEELVDWVVSSPAQGQKDIIDIGTGNGCIALALKKYLPSAKVTAIDISEGALSVARENAATYSLEINFSQADFLDPAVQDALPVFDIIISNPPYIGLDEKAGILPNVLNYEPHAALFVTDNDPLQFYKAIAQFGAKHLAVNGKIFCELHRDYAVATQQYFEANGWHTELRKDMQQNDRMLCCQR